MGDLKSYWELFSGWMKLNMWESRMWEERESKIVGNLTGKSKKQYLYKTIVMMTVWGVLKNKGKIIPPSLWLMQLKIFIIYSVVG